MMNGAAPRASLEAPDHRRSYVSTILSTLFAADYPFLDVLWTMLIFFLWVMWFWLLIVIIGDVFRRRDIGGGKKTIWLIFILFVPFIGVLAYVLANSDGMAERNMERARKASRLRSTTTSARPQAAVAPPRRSTRRSSCSTPARSRRRSSTRSRPRRSRDGRTRRGEHR